MVDFFIFYFFQFLMLYYEAIQSTMSWISCISAQLYDFTFCFFMDFVGILHVLIEQCFFMLCCFYLTILVNLCESICCSFNALFWILLNGSHGSYWTGFPLNWCFLENSGGGLEILGFLFSVYGAPSYKTHREHNFPARTYPKCCNSLYNL